MAPPLAVPQRPLGSTGVSVSCLGLGGSHIGKPKVGDVLAVTLMRAAIDAGVDFFDNCWDYHNGRSERLMGKALTDGYRQRVFLMTKFDARTKVEAAQQIDASLARLKTDYVDLLQLHEVIRFEDPDRFFAKGGAAEAALAAKKAGKARFLGFTGHKDPRVHLYMLEVAQRNGFRFDAVQMPLNPFDAHFRSFEQLVLPDLLRQGIAVLGMKSMGGGVLLKSKAVTAVECLRYALSLPTSVVITGIDSRRVLRQALEVADSFTPLSATAMAAIRGKAAPQATAGEYELFKTSAHYDSTAANPKWLGEGESPRILRLTGKK